MANQPRVIVPYNPLDKKNLGISVADALIETDSHALPPAYRFTGAGIYAIYYEGTLDLYKSMDQSPSTLGRRSQRAHAKEV